MLFKSPFLESIPLLGKTLDPSTFRDRMTGTWTTIGVVSALFLTMLNYPNPAICEEELVLLTPSQGFCDTLHPLLCVIAMASNVVAVIMTLNCPEPTF